MSLEQAQAMLRDGDAIGAEMLLADHAGEAAARVGKEHPEYAAALFDLALLQCEMRDMTRALATLLEAAAVPAVGNEAAHLTYTTNLGELLVAVGKLDEAEAVIREALPTRAALYGEEHPGHAVGMEPLVTVLMVTGRYAEALRWADRARDILFAAEDDRVVELMALRTPAAVFEKADAMARVHELNEDQQASFVAHVADLALPPELQRRALEEVMVHVGGPGWELLAWALANALAELEAHAERATLLTHLAAQLDRKEQVDCWMGAAYSLAELGAEQDAKAAYGQAMSVVDDDGQRSHVARNYGLFLSEISEFDRADDLLSIAVDAASAAEEDDAMGRALVARGVFRQHRGFLDDAQAMLEAGIALLPPEDTDSLCGRSHLDAIENDGSCGCGHLGLAIGDAMMELVAPHLPEGLLDSIAYDEDEGLQIALLREPTEQEMELLQRVIGQARAKLDD